MNECMTVSVGECGKLLGIGRGTAFRLVHEGRIKALRLGRKLRVSRAEIDRLLSGDCGRQAEVSR